MLPVYEITLGEDVFTVKTWEDVHTMWNEYVWAVGAEDAEMKVRFVSC